MAEFESLVIDETLYTTRLTAKFNNRKAWVPPDNRKVLAFLPGTVVNVLVEKGQPVKTGQVLIKFEAMKMINTVQSFTNGRVKDVNVKVGDKFPKGFLLVEFE